MFERTKKTAQRAIEEVKATKADLRYELPEGVVMPEVQPVKTDPEAEAASKARFALAQAAVRPVVVSPARHGKRAPHVPQDRRIPLERRTLGR